MNTASIKALKISQANFGTASSVLSKDRGHSARTAELEFRAAAGAESVRSRPAMTVSKCSRSRGQPESAGCGQTAQRFDGVTAPRTGTSASSSRRDTGQAVRFGGGPVGHVQHRDTAGAYKTASSAATRSPPSTERSLGDGLHIKLKPLLTWTHAGRNLRTGKTKFSITAAGLFH